jgi:hypothetical protein
MKDVRSSWPFARAPSTQRGVEGIEVTREQASQTRPIIFSWRAEEDGCPLLDRGRASSAGTIGGLGDGYRARCT